MRTQAFGVVTRALCVQANPRSSIPEVTRIRVGVPRAAAATEDEHEDMVVDLSAVDVDAQAAELARLQMARERGRDEGGPSGSAGPSGAPS